MTTRLLTINPEFYSVWNYRRDIFTEGIFREIPPHEVNNFLSEDLAMTMTFLRRYPKVYWIWNHRRWCLEHVPDGPADSAQSWRQRNWTKELSVVEKMLDADPRNFHAWDYRRYVLASMPERRPPGEELTYTTLKIESNFSNFSAWHQRSKIYLEMWESGLSNRQKTMDEEFELVKQAMYVDPNDQSAWIYHRWLLASGHDENILRREIAVIEELLEVEPDSKWCLESLVHYKRLLISNHSISLSESERSTIKQQCQQMLKQLQAIDPQRLHRYHELAESMNADHC